VFVRIKTSGSYQYLQIVQNERIDGHVHQQVVATLGRLDVLQAKGQVDGLLSSCARFAQNISVLDAYQHQALPAAATVRIGPPLVFERLWQQLGLAAILEERLTGRRYEFAVERAVFVTVLHRLLVSGSDRAAEQWYRDYAIAGAEGLQLHHLYRAMAWLGEELGADQQAGATGFVRRCVKDEIEESLFARRQTLFRDLDLVFFDTTSVYFEGQGGQTMGRHGHSKDHRPDLKQMVVGAVLDSTGRPIGCELWPGNTTDVKTLIPIVDRLRERFHIQRICLVADRGMISKQTIAELGQPARGVHFILGARRHLVKEVRQVVVSDHGPYEPVQGPKTHSKDPAPLEVKEVKVGSHRYVVCRNADQAKKDREDRQAIVAHLREQLQQGDKSLVGNQGYRKYLKTTGTSHRFEIDEDKIKAQEPYDGLWVLQTDLDLPAKEVALRYKELWRVEQIFRTIKTILENRPIYHKVDATIRGHAFCSFLALVLLKELQTRMEQRGWVCEWDCLKADLDTLQEVTVQAAGQPFVIRTQTRGAAGQALQAAGVALGPVVRAVSEAAS
jgi:transposase